jgi:CubicO group peptidase (beta-lactamase class C family)
MRYGLLLCYTLCLVGCGGGGGSAPAPAPADPWAAVAAELDRFAVDDLAIIVGDADGERWRYEKGQFRVAESYLIASASKWLTGATLMALVEQGVMSLSDRPQDHLGYWTNDPQDERSQITLAMLLSFTAGYSVGPIDASCVNNAAITLAACAREFYDAGLDTTPGSTFYYGPAHMQVAAAMAEAATGQTFNEIVRLTLAQPLGLSAATRFVAPSTTNPRASGGGQSTALDYAAFLQALLDGGFLAGSLDTFLQDRTGDPVVFGYRPGAITDNNVDWHYGLGFWRECNQPAWDATCADRRLVSSPGAFGWHPWIDFDEGYYAVLAMQEPATLFASPSEAAVLLAFDLRPLIEAALSAP